MRTLDETDQIIAANATPCYIKLTANVKMYYG